MRCAKRLSRCRRGASTVELAVVLPLILILVFGFVEVGYRVNSQQILHDAARQGARAAVHIENSNAEVEAAVLRSLDNSMAVDAEAVSVRISVVDNSGSEQYEVQSLSQNEQGLAIRVMVTVDYDQFSPPCDYLGLANNQLIGSVVMQRKN